MRELVYYVAVSIDGFIADAQGDAQAFLAEGDHASVIFEEFADALPVHALAALGITPPRSRFDTVVMGWNTLQPALSVGIASPYPHLHQVVASRTERNVDDVITLISDPVSVVRELKTQSGLDIWLCGGGALAGALLPEVDRLVLKRNPIAFGEGIGLFGGVRHDAAAFDVVDVRRFDSGVIIEEYVRRR